MRSLACLLFVIAGCGRQASSPKPGPEAASVSSAPPAAGPSAPPAAGPSAPPTGPAAEACPPGECGPPMRMPTHRCPDGSMGGPTGQCLRKPDGRCGWEVRACP